MVRWMNGLIPALVAVLLTEVGPRGAVYAAASGRLRTVFAIAALVAASAVAGSLIAPRLAPHAETLLIALALGFSAWAQVVHIVPGTTTRAALFAFWRGGTAFLVLALAARFEAASVGIGAAIALFVAAAFGPSVTALSTPLVRRLCAGLLLGAGAALAVIGLRLV